MYKLLGIIVVMILSLSRCRLSNSYVNFTTTTESTSLSNVESSSEQELQSKSSKEESVSVSSVVESTISMSEQSYTREDYRQILESARDTQQQYIDSLPSEQRQGLQTSQAAMVVKYQELLQNNPNDQELLDQILEELTRLDEDSIVNKSPAEVIAEYSSVTGLNYLQGTPATQRNYYGFAVPDQILDMTYLDGNQISFKFHGYVSENGPQYELIDCYVSEEGTEIILFVEKDGNRMVLQSTAQPVDRMLNIQISQNETLNTFVQ